MRETSSGYSFEPRPASSVPANEQTDAGSYEDDPHRCLRHRRRSDHGCRVRRHRRLLQGADSAGRLRAGVEKRACTKHAGRPSFHDPKDTDAVELIQDRSHGMVRAEVRCARCGSHPGHVFEGEGCATPTDQRYRINSISLRLTPDEA